jgi:hypothetical protein
LGLEDLRIVPQDESTVDSDDSDDEDPNSEYAVPDEELMVTTLNLLLAILEGEFLNTWCFMLLTGSESEHRAIRKRDPGIERDIWTTREFVQRTVRFN